MNKKYKLTQRIPGGVDPFIDPKTLEFDTLDELLSCGWVMKYKSDTYQNFCLNYEKPRNDMNWALLMIVSEDEYKWWCVGYIESNNAIDLTLPDWKPKYKPKNDE